jgi:hypothetical protein
MSPAATQHAAQQVSRANVFSAAPILCLVLVLFPAVGSADTLISFGNMLPSTGTINGNTVSGVGFDTINGITVNNFVEAYSNGVLTFSVGGGGNLETTGTFSNVSGTFLTINETAPTFGTNPQSVNLFTTVTSFSVSSALLSDLGLPSLVQLDSAPLTTEISVTSQANGNVISTNAIFAFQSPLMTQAPEPATLSMLGLGLLGAGWLGLRRRERVA